MPPLTCAGALPPEVAARHPDVALIVDEVRIVQLARQHRSVVYLMGRTHARLTKGGLAHLPRRYLLEMPFKVQPQGPSVSHFLNLNQNLD